MATRTRKATSPEVLTVEAIAAMSDSERKKALIDEQRAEKDALAKGVADFPTPVKDFNQAALDAAGGKSKPKKVQLDPALKGTDAPKGLVNFLVDGRRVAETQHTLSYMAGYSRTKTEPRIKTSVLTQLIVEATGLSAADLLRKEWTFTLPQSGRVISTQLIPGRTEEAAPVAAEAEVKPTPRTRKPKVEQPAAEEAPAAPARRTRKPKATEAA